MDEKGLLHEELTYAIRGVLFDVYNALGPGFREETYRQAVICELTLRKIPFETEKKMEVSYKGKVIDGYKMDLVVDSRVVLELKAVDELHPRFEAQLLSYLRASGARVGMLVNFGSDELMIERKIL